MDDQQQAETIDNHAFRQLTVEIAEDFGWPGVGAKDASAYMWCVYPTPHTQSGICGLGRTWHERRDRERLAETSRLEVSDIVTYDQAKAAAHMLTSQTEINSEITQTAAWQLLARWADQKF